MRKAFQVVIHAVLRMAEWVGITVLLTVVSPVIWLVLTFIASWVPYFLGFSVTMTMVVLVVIYIIGISVTTSVIVVQKSSFHVERWPFVTAGTSILACIYLIAGYALGNFQPVEEFWMIIAYSEAVIISTFFIDRLTRRWYC